MTYLEERSKIKSGDIIACTHKKWLSLHDLEVQAVRTFTQSEYSHVALTWVVGGRVFVIEAVEPKVRIMPLSNLIEEDKGVYWIHTDKEMSEEELQFLLSKVGVASYSKLQAILAYLKKLKIGDDNKFECAELVIAARKLSGLDLGNVATPSAVVQATLDLGYELKFIK